MGRGVAADASWKSSYPPPDHSQASLRMIDLPLKGGGEGAAAVPHYFLPNFCTASCRWHFTRWSLTMPTACMKA